MAATADSCGQVLDFVTDAMCWFCAVCSSLGGILQRADSYCERGVVQRRCHPVSHHHFQARLVAWRSAWCPLKVNLWSSTVQYLFWRPCTLTRERGGGVGGWERERICVYVFARVWTRTLDYVMWHFFSMMKFLMCVIFGGTEDVILFFCTIVWVITFTS